MTDVRIGDPMVLFADAAKIPIMSFAKGDITPLYVLVELIGDEVDVEVEPNGVDDIALPLGSPFQDWKEARRFAGPLPFTFDYSPSTGKVLIIEGVRGSWVPQPVKVSHYNFSFLDNMNLTDLRLANAFVIENIPYYWKKGKLELWREA